MEKEKTAYWDGRNDAGERVASGIYFYTIKTDKFIATKKTLNRDAPQKSPLGSI
jgi:hypothetical protein